MEELSQPNHKSKQFEPLIWLFTMACKWSLSICLFLFVCVWGLGHKQAVRGVDRWTDLPPTPPTPSQAPPTPSQAPPLPFWLSLKIKEQETKTRKQTKSDRYFWTPFSGIYSYEHKNCKLAKKSKEHVHLWSCSSIEEQKKYNKSQKFIASYSRGFGSNAFSPSPFEMNII